MAGLSNLYFVSHLTSPIHSVSFLRLNLSFSDGNHVDPTNQCESPPADMENDTPFEPAKSFEIGARVGPLGKTRWATWLRPSFQAITD